MACALLCVTPASSSRDPSSNSVELGRTPFSAHLRPWMTDLTNARHWYHYQCQNTGKSRFLSSSNLLAVANATHCWLLSNDSPVWTHICCASCGSVYRPGQDIMDPPPAWCPSCDHTVSGWLPVTREPLLSVTWFRFLCLRCGRPSLYGNDPDPSQCVHCLECTDERTFLRPLLSGIPTSLHCWTQALHTSFPPSFRSVIRTLLMAFARPNASCWLPSDVRPLLFGFMAPAPTTDPIPWAQCVQNSPLVRRLEEDINGDSDNESDSDSDAITAEASVAHGSDSDSAGRITPPPFVGIWRW